MAKQREQSDYKKELLVGQPGVTPEVASPPAPEAPSVPQESPELATAATEPVVDQSAPAVPETPSQATSEPGLVQRLQELGFQDVEDENQATSRLYEAYRQQAEQMKRLEEERKRFEPLAQYGDEYLRMARDPEVQEFLAQRRQQQQQARPAPKQETDPWWNPPKFDPAWKERYMEWDQETQAPKWKPNAPAEVRAASDQYEQYVQDWTTSLIHRPHEVLPKVIQSVVEPLFEQYFQQRYSEIEQRQFLEQVRQQNADWLYVRDPRTNQPIVGEFTPEGRHVLDIASQLAEAGVTDIQKQWELAKQFANVARERQAAQQTLQAQTTIQRVEEAKRAQTRRVAAATATPNRAGSIPRRTQEEPRAQNRRLRPGDQLLAQMELDGVGTT